MMTIYIPNFCPATWCSFSDLFELLFLYPNTRVIFNNYIFYFYFLRDELYPDINSPNLSYTTLAAYLSPLLEKSHHTKQIFQISLWLRYWLCCLPHSFLKIHVITLDLRGWSRIISHVKVLNHIYHVPFAMWSSINTGPGSWNVCNSEVSLFSLPNATKRET